MTRQICNTCHVFMLRLELQAAHDEMDAQGGHFVYAVSRARDGQAWEVNTKQGHIYSALDGSYANRDEANLAGIAWVGDLMRGG